LNDRLRVVLALGLVFVWLQAVFNIGGGHILNFREYDRGCRASTASLNSGDVFGSLSPSIIRKFIAGTDFNNKYYTAI
jgi:hypothetical protein